MAPNLTLRTLCAVGQIGSDDPQYNPVGAPQARLTIAAALADLAANYPPASATFPHVISVEPGTWSTPAFALPPFTWIVGNPDGPTNAVAAVVISLTGNITLGTGWQTNQTAAGGLIGLTIRQSTSQTIDLTMPTPSAGNPSRVFTLRDLRTDCDALVWQATGTADVIHCEQLIHDGNTADAIGFTSGTARLKNCSLQATVTYTSGAAIALTVVAVASAHAVLILTKGAAALTATFDAVSTPIRSLVTLNGGAVFARSNDANGDGYSPTTPGDWPVVPTTVQAALDELAAAGGGTTGSAYLATNNNAGNSTITPASRILWDLLTIGGAARTSVIILDVTGQAAGAMVSFDCVFPATAAIVTQWRNATAGGTLLEQFTTDGVTLSGTLTFVYNGAAWVLWQSVFGP